VLRSTARSQEGAERREAARGGRLRRPERVAGQGSESGGGGNRTRVRESLRKSLYKLRLPLEFARRPVCSRPTAGLAILRCRASGDWLSLGAEPVF
jgi:hypothetical protein